MKRLYRKFLIWHHGKFRNRITRCKNCKFRVFNNEYRAYGKMLSHTLFGCVKQLTISQQLNYIESETKKLEKDFINNILDNEP